MRYIKEKFRFMQKHGVETFGSSLSDAAKKSVLDSIEAPQEIRQVIVDEAIERKEPLIDETKELVNDTATLSIPEVFLKDADVVNELQRLGIIDSNRAVIENTKVFEKYKKYIDVLNFISDVERDDNQAILNQKELVNNYLFLTNEASNFIGGKENIQMMYITAIYDDIIRNGGVLISNGISGNYEIIWGNWDKLNEYNRVLESANVRNVIDVAIVSSMIGKDFNLNARELVGQKSLITYILDKHAIKSENGEKIQPRLLKLEKTHLLSEINSLLGKSKSIQDQQELTFLKNYIWDTDQAWDYEKKGYNRELFKNLNKYKAFEGQRELIQAMPELANPEKLEDKDFISVMTKIAEDNQMAAFWVAIVAWLLDFKKVALGSAIFGAIAPSVWRAVWDLNKEVQKWITDEDLELVDQQDVVFSVEDQAYQAWYEKLANVNKQNRVNQYNEKNQKLPSIDNQVLVNLVDVITLNSIDLDMRSINSIKLKSALTDAKVDIKDIKDEDIKAFIKLLQSDNFEKDSEDKTILDYLSDGRDILNLPYVWVSFTESPEINTEINNVLQNKWDKEKITGLDRKDLNEMKTFIKDEFLIASKGLDSIKTFFTGAWWENEAEMPSFDVDININNALNKIKTIDNSIYIELEPILDDYKTYLKLEKELSTFTWIIDENSDKSWAMLYGILWLGTVEDFNLSVLDTATNYTRDKEVANKSKLWMEIGEKITKLEKLRVIGDSANKEPFLTQNKKIDKLINSLTEVRSDIMIDIQWSTGINSSQQNVDTITTQYEWTGIVSIRQNVDSHMREIDEFNTNGNVDDLLESLNELKLPYTELNKYLSKLPVNEGHTGGEVVRNTIEWAIKTQLKYFELKKGEIEKNVKSKLEDYYTQTWKVKTTVEAIDATDIDSLKGSLTALQKAKSYIDGKNSDTYSAAGFVLTKTTTGNGEDKMNIASFDIWSTAIDLSYVFDAVNSDKKIANAITESKKIFGDTFEVTWTENNLASLKKTYESKIESIKELSITYLDSINVNDMKAKEDMKVKEIIGMSLLLRQIRDAYGSVSLIHWKADEKLKAISGKYLEIDVKDDPELLKNIDKDIAANTEKLQKQELELQQLESTPDSVEKKANLQVLREANNELRNKIAILSEMKESTGSIIGEWIKAVKSFWKETIDYFDSLWVSVGLFDAPAEVNTQGGTQILTEEPEVNFPWVWNPRAVEKTITVEKEKKTEKDVEKKEQSLTGSLLNKIWFGQDKN